VRSLAFLVAVLATALGGCAQLSEVAPTPVRQFHLEWQASPDPRGSVVRGFLGNPYGVAARDIHLLVEGLDADGTVVTKTTSVLKRIVLSGDRASFDVLVPGAAAERYHVSVVSYDLVLPRGGR